MRKQALIIIDMLNDFINEKGALYCGESAKAIVPFVQSRLKAFRESDGTVIFLKDSHDENDKEFERFPIHCISETWGSEIIPELVPLSNEILIPKKRFSGFFETDLGKILKDKGVKSVEVTGLCTSICVMDTVGGLADRDYSITVPRDGVADFDQEFHYFSLKRMEKIYGALIV
jgi:nicotinamidase-related amidase